MNRSIVIVVVLGVGLLTASAGIAKVFDPADLYSPYEQQCLDKGWQKITVDVNGVKRQILFKEPVGEWSNGAIIMLHGEGGSYADFCSGIAQGRMMVKFGAMALNEGFAVFSPDAGMGMLKDDKGNSCGKRWSAFGQKRNMDNPDLQFIKKIIEDVIPQQRPEGAPRDIFMVGLSNGGFMTALASTYFSHKISAFATVGSGDAYGTTIDCSINPLGRKTPPAVLFDKQTGERLSVKDACKNDAREQGFSAWPLPGSDTIKYRHFYHEGDAAIDRSCHQKLVDGIRAAGYSGEESFVIPEKHEEQPVFNRFWQDEYSQPVLDFFKQVVFDHGPAMSAGEDGEADSPTDKEEGL